MEDLEKYSAKNFKEFLKQDINDDEITIAVTSFINGALKFRLENGHTDGLFEINKWYSKNLRTIYLNKAAKMFKTLGYNYELYEDTFKILVQLSTED